MTLPGTSRPSYKVAFYIAMTVLALFGLLWRFLPGLFGEQVTTTVNSSDVATVDLFNDLYYTGWRSEGKAGNTAIEAVYYYPSLTVALKTYAERTLLQAQVLQEIEGNQQNGLYPFLVMLEHSEPFPASFSPADHVSLVSDKGTSYSVDHYTPMTVVGTSGKQASGVVWFTSVGDTPTPQTLTLSFDGLPGNTEPTSFSWNLDALR